MFRCVLGCVVSFGLKNDVVLVASLLSDEFRPVCVFFVLLVGFFGRGLRGSVGLVVFHCGMLVLLVWGFVHCFWMMLVCFVW